MASPDSPQGSIATCLHVSASSKCIDLPPQIVLSGGRTMTFAKKIGEGGFGSTWRATLSGHSGFVLCKMLRTHLRHDDRLKMFRERMRNEARILSGISVDGVPRLIENLCDHDPPAIVMECIDGISWRDFASHPLICAIPLPTLLKLLTSFTEVLAALHEQCIVHGDIKPENVLLGRLPEKPWRAWIVDFGLARREETLRTRITSEGLTLGTHGYLDPRLVGNAKDRDREGDIFSAGTLLYECYSGEQLFTSAQWRDALQSEAIRQSIIDERFSSLRRSARDTALERLIRAMVDADIEKRPRAHHVHQELLRILTMHGRTDSKINIPNLLCDTDDRALLARHILSHLSSKREGPSRRRVMTLIALSMSAAALSVAGLIAFGRDRSRSSSSPNPSPSPSPRTSSSSPLSSLRLAINNEVLTLMYRDKILIEKNLLNCLRCSGADLPEGVGVHIVPFDPNETASLHAALHPEEDLRKPSHSIDTYLYRHRFAALLDTPHGSVFQSPASEPEIFLRHADITKSKHVREFLETFSVKKPVFRSILKPPSAPSLSPEQRKDALAFANNNLQLLLRNADVRR